MSTEELDSALVALCADEQLMLTFKIVYNLPDTQDVTKMQNTFVPTKRMLSPVSRMKDLVTQILLRLSTCPCPNFTKMLIVNNHELSKAIVTYAKEIFDG
jgi:hypothetical protein